MTTANILRIHPSSLRNNIECSKQIEQKQKLLLRLAQKNCRILIHEQRTQKTSIMEDEQESAFVAMNAEMGAKRAAQLFKRAKDTKQMMSEFPSKMNCPGVISSN
jgi:hypothetical protein